MKPKKNISDSYIYKWQYFLLSFGVKIFLTIGMPILLFLVILFYYNFSTVSKDLANRYINATKTEVEGLLTTFNSIQSNFSLDADLQKYLLNSKHNYQTGTYVNKFDNDTTNFCIANPAIQSIYIYRCSDDYIIAAGNNPPTNNYATRFIDKNYINSNIEQHYLLVRKADFSNSTQTLLTCNYPIYYNALLAGFISINVDTSIFQEKILQLVPKDSHIDVIYNNLPLISLPSDTGSNHLNKFEYSVNLLNGNISISDSIKGQNLTILLNYNQNNSTANIFINSKLFLIFIVFLLLLCVLLAYLLTSKYYKAMVSIIMKSTLSLDWYGVNNTAGDNVRTLSGNNKKIESKLNERLASFRDLQFKFLQTQISPHFLFNALNVISMMDLEIFKHQTQIGKTVRLLSDILRYSITGSDFMSPFTKELEYSLKYLKLQNKRYNNRIDYTYSIAPGVENIEIIKFTLQPVVENAIHYAVIDENICHININADIVKHNLRIDVSNTGANIDAFKLTELNETLKAGKLNPEHISGLLNVNKRIKLIYGEDYGCNIFQFDNDTHLIIEIPIK